MYVVNKQFKLLEFVFDSVYVDLLYDDISFTFNAGPVSLCCICGHLWSVCEFVVVPYVVAVQCDVCTVMEGGVVLCLCEL